MTGIAPSTASVGLWGRETALGREIRSLSLSSSATERDGHRFYVAAARDTPGQTLSRMVLVNAHCSFSSLEDINELLTIKLGPFPVDAESSRKPTSSLGTRPPPHRFFPLGSPPVSTNPS